MSKILSYIRLMRISQWTKNLFVFLPVFFDRRIFDTDVLGATLAAFFGFSLVSGAVYCFNDLHDREEDRLHPVKCRRPVASGRVSVAEGLILMVVLLVAGMLVAYRWGGTHAGYLCGVLAGYFFLNLFYTFGLKRFALLDVLIIAVGFVLRLLAGGIASGIRLSGWIVVMTFLLSLFLILAKRRDDVVLAAKGITVRKSVRYYNLDFLNSVLSVLSAVILSAYLMYTLSPEVMEQYGCDYLYLTAVFVVAGILRYLQLTLVFHKSGNPVDILLKDRFTQVCVAGWLLSFGLIIYVQ